MKNFSIALLLSVLSFASYAKQDTTQLFTPKSYNCTMMIKNINTGKVLFEKIQSEGEKSSRITQTPELGVDLLIDLSESKNVGYYIKETLQGKKKGEAEVSFYKIAGAQRKLSQDFTQVIVEKAELLGTLNVSGNGSSFAEVDDKLLFVGCVQLY